MSDAQDKTSGNRGPGNTAGDGSGFGATIDEPLANKTYWFTQQPQPAMQSCSGSAAGGVTSPMNVYAQIDKYHLISSIGTTPPPSAQLAQMNSEYGWSIDLPCYPSTNIQEAWNLLTVWIEYPPPNGTIRLYTVPFVASYSQ